MAESPDSRPSKAGSSTSTGGFLPRLWKAESGPVAEDPNREKTSSSPETPVPGTGTGTGTKKGKRKKHRPTPEVSESPRKSVLLEETPGLDTIEARRTARLIAGSVATLLIVLAGYLVVRILVHSRSPVEERNRTDPTIALENFRRLKERNETEARTLIERARMVARRGNTDTAVSLLRQVQSTYPETRAASEADEALSVPRDRLRLFLDNPQEARRVPQPGTIAISTAPTAPAAPATPVPSGSQVPAVGAAGSPPRPAQLPPETEAAPLAVASPAGPAPAAAPRGDPAAASKAARAPGGAEPTPIRTLPAGYQARTGVDVDPSGWPREIVGGRDGSMMVLVPGGSFVMGQDGGDPTEGPAHPVKVSTFYIDKHEVTNRQFEKFLKESAIVGAGAAAGGAPARSDRDRVLVREGAGVNVSEDFPVVMVSAKEARDYADWAGKRLPTEAQWEKAARGTDRRPYPWGPSPTAWDKPRAPQQIDAVMSFPTDLSPYGACDMAGNAAEWTRDWFDPDLYASLRGQVVEDPGGPANRPASLQLTVKGASRQWLVAAREGIKPDARLPYLGFRCTLPVEGPDSVLQPAPGAVPGQAAPAGTPKKVFVPF
jgi:formylglycine-generating enzyme required for sulfatase activity